MSNCINSTHALTSGYGTIYYKGRFEKHHRVAYAEHHGIDISELAGYFILHSCDNRACINPEHLRKGTHTENMQDVVVRKSCEGRKLARPRRLSMVAILSIRVSPLGHPELAALHGVSKRTIQCVVSRTDAYTDSKLAEAI